MPSFFDLLAPFYDQLFPARRPRTIMELLDLPVKHFVEIGGGTGRIAKYFLPYCEEAWLVEPSLSMLLQAKRHSGLKLVQAFAQELPFPDNYFDVVLIYDSLHHWSNHKAALAEIFRILGPDKFLVVGEIHPYHRSGYFIQLMENMFRMRPTFYSHQDLKQVFEDVGFEVIKQGWVRQPTYYTLATKPSS